MKLTALFAKFLYQHKELKLPGLGVFTLDPSVHVPDISDKNYSDFTSNIRFTQKNITQADDEFINFIRTETGKIKPLAESDLDSFLSDGKILLNIGKPFRIDGIGSLMKTREGNYEFTPGEAVLQKSVAPASEHVEDLQKPRSTFRDEIPEQNNSRKILIAISAIAGIVLIVWLGYSLYNRNTNAAMGTSSVTVAPTDTSSSNILLDSVQNKIDSVSRSIQNTANTGGTYKFIIERTTNKARAYRRYNQIKETLTDIKLESKDSTLFSLYFVLPAQPTDTARIKDSLRIWYGRRQVWVQ